MACPDPETLAALAENRLSPARRDPVLDHAASCDECRQTLLILGELRPAAVTRRLRPAGRPWLPWAAAAAIFTVCIIGVLLLRKDDPKPETAVRTIPKREEPRPEPVTPEPPKPTPPDAPKPIVPPKRENPEPAPIQPPAPEPRPAPEVPVIPEPEKPAPTPPAPAPEMPKPATAVVVAVLGKVEGDVAVISGPVRTPAKAGQELRALEGVECRGPRSWALLVYPDKTRVEVEGDTLVRELLPRDAGKGLRVVVDKGAVRAEVAKQPAGQPMIFETPYGEATVVGTVLRVGVDAKSARLDVEEGKVELRNAAGRAVLVEAGHFAVAAPGAAPASKRFPKEEFLLAHDFEDGKKPAAFSASTVVQGPDRRVCLAPETDAGGSSRVTISDEDGLFVATGDEVLSFDYWVDAQAASVNVSLWNRTAKQPIEGGLSRLTTGKWAHATMKLAELGEVRMKDGDWVVSLLLQATGGAPRRFYVDNLVISRPRSLKPRTLDPK